MLTLDVDKQDLISMIRGSSPSMDDCIALERTGMMRFTGNQHNEKWDWDERKLSSYSEYNLYRLYMDYKVIYKK